LAVERVLDLKSLGPDAWDALWNEVKTAEKTATKGVQ
jgi:hypothetical protein